MTFDFSARRDAAIAMINANPECDAFITTDPSDVQWLTGLDSSNAAVLLSRNDVLVVTDGRYAGSASATGLPVVVNRDVVGTARSHAEDAALGKVATNDSTQLVLNLRMVKDALEVEELRAACEVSVSALEVVVSRIRVGMTEIGIARELEYGMSKAGADDRSFPSIVATGSNSAIPHHKPTSRCVAPGDMLKIDFGAQVAGYHADCTRTFVVGADPTPDQAKIHALVEIAAAAARTALRPGAAISEVDAAARTPITEAGFADQFVHGLGHGVGLEVHEPPLLSATSVGTLSVGNAVTIEPGIYLPGNFGVRIEDVCLVTEDGCQVLTNYPRALMRIG